MDYHWGIDVMPPDLEIVPGTTIATAMEQAYGVKPDKIYRLPLIAISPVASPRVQVTAYFTIMLDRSGRRIDRSVTLYVRSTVTTLLEIFEKIDSGNGMPPHLGPLLLPLRERARTRSGSPTLGITEFFFPTGEEEARMTLSDLATNPAGSRERLRNADIFMKGPALATIV